MKICIVGAGAVGGYLGGRLALAGEEVTLIARGAHLKTIQENGLKLEEADGSSVIVQNIRATDSFDEAGIQDVVIVTLKAQSVASVAPDMRKLYGPETVVIPAQNGVAWWYFRGQTGPYQDYRIEAVDPGGVIEANLEIERVLGCVVYLAAELPAPGVIHHDEGDRFILGELDDSKTDRLRLISQAINRAGLRAPLRSSIRTEMWTKLWGNVVFNPLSAITGALLGQICDYEPGYNLVRDIMTETREIAEKLGIDFGISIEQRIEGARRLSGHKSSMLQDVEAGRPTEIEAIVGAVSELGRLTNTPTPHIDTLYASVKLLEFVREQAKTAGKAVQ